MGWLLALFKSFPALSKILEQIGKALKNVQSIRHVSHAKRDISAAIQRVRDKRSSPQQRKQTDRDPQ
jgi:translation elongation factor EF-Tu-like GTPase